MRDRFLLDPDVVFLNHGAYGACPREVFEVYQRWQLELERNPVDFLGRRSAALLAEARAALAACVGASPAHLVFVPNATTGVNVVARSLALHRGDEILATDLEYGACDATWAFVCARTGAVQRRVAIPLPFERERFVEQMMRHVTPRTQLLFASHVASNTALILPIAALCAAARARGLPTLIDGAHGPGHLPLDLGALGADFYIGNCHKWLGAPKGAAFLHARPEHHERLDAGVISWGYVAARDAATVFDAYTGTTTLERRMQWQGTRDIAAYLAVAAAIDFQRRNDWDRVRARCHAMAVATMHRLAARFGLAPIGCDDDFGQMAAIPLPRQVAEGLLEGLARDRRIEVPVTRHRDHAFVRISVQGYNTQADLDALCDVPALRAPGTASAR